MDKILLFVATPTSTISVYYFRTIHVNYFSTIHVYYFSTIHVYYFSTIRVYYFSTIHVYYFSTICVYYFSTIRVSDNSVSVYSILLLVYHTQMVTPGSRKALGSCRKRSYTNFFNFSAPFIYSRTSCANRAQLATVWSTGDTCTVCGHPTMSNYFTMYFYKIVGVAVLVFIHIQTFF